MVRSLQLVESARVLLSFTDYISLLKHDSSQDDADEINGSIGESSSRALLHACSNPEVVDSAPLTHRVLDSASRTESPNISSVTTDSGTYFLSLIVK